ncbi:MAG: tetratricopeptide repeat protein, partial [Candidatus Eisenbacteria bacterium]|nr:tetratricopeptide repeat protein [Candidatus Eisenbacteria bacterium]
PEDTVAQRRHVAYFVALVEEAEPHLFGALMGPWLDRLATEHANLLAALDACYEDPEGVETGLRIAGSLGRYWHVRGHVGLGTRQLERMLRREGAEAPGAARAKALSMAGALASCRGAWEEATICLEEALSLFRSLGDRLWEGRSLMTLGSVYFHLGDTERAWSICEAGLAASKEVDDVRGIATVLINLGVLAYGRGDKGSAHRLFGEAAALHRRSGDQATLALALGNRSALSVQLGDYASARSELAEALRLALELDAVWSGIAALASAGTMALARGAPGEAAVMLAAATSGVERAELDLSAGQRNELDRIVAQVRDASAPESFAEAWSKGLAFSFPEAADFVLGWLLRDQTATS